MVESVVDIPGYAYGSAALEQSTVSLSALDELKITVGFTVEDATWLRMAGEVLADQISDIVRHWRSHIIASIPHLAKHSRALDGSALPEYLAQSNRRFEQWILDTCFRPYDEEWIAYQLEIGRRHTSAGKNRTDDVTSTPYVPWHDILGFIAVINETIRPHIAAKGHGLSEVDCMHRAWCKSIQLQMALWTLPYASNKLQPGDW